MSLGQIGLSNFYCYKNSYTVLQWLILNFFLFSLIFFNFLHISFYFVFPFFFLAIAKISLKRKKSFKVETLLRMYIQLMISLLQAHVVTIYYNLLLLCLGLIFCLCLLYIYHMSYTMKFNSQKCCNFFLLNFHFISNTSDAIFFFRFSVCMPSKLPYVLQIESCCHNCKFK